MGNFQRHLAELRDWYLWISYSYLSFWGEILVFSFLALLFVYWQIPAVLISVLWLCHFRNWTFTKGQAKGRKVSPVLLIADDLKRVREATSQYWSYICGMKYSIFVFVGDYCWFVWSFICFSLKSEEKPSHKTTTMDGSEENYSARKRKTHTHTKPNETPNKQP